MKSGTVKAKKFVDSTVHHMFSYLTHTEARQLERAYKESPKIRYEYAHTYIINCRPNQAFDFSVQ